MNDSLNSYTIHRSLNIIQLTDRLLAIYSLILILIGTPCNLLCCLIYFQKLNRSNSIKTIFGYLAILDTIVLYTFNLNYVFREFSTNIKIINNHNSTSDLSTHNSDTKSVGPFKKNLEEHSLFICRFLSYLAFSTLQTSSWILAFGSLNRYLLIKKLSKFEFICKRFYTIIICCVITCIFFISNIHILWMNGYRPTSGKVVCYSNKIYPNYMIWYQRLHLFLYSAFPTVILFIFNILLMRLIFASKKRLQKHKRLVLFAATATTSVPSHRRRDYLVQQQSPSEEVKPLTKATPSKTLNGHSRKLTISLIFITISYFTLTFPSTVIFSFIRPYIKSVYARRSLSSLFTNLSTTTHAIRFFIYFFCSTDFRHDFYQICPVQRRSSCFNSNQRSKTTQR